MDAEIYVDRIADSRINDLNAMLEITRKQVQEQYAADDDLYMRTLELAQVQTDDYFKAVVAEDLAVILRDIRDAPIKDETTADETAIAAQVGKGLKDAMSYEGSPQEKQIRAHLATLGISYDDLTKEEFVTLIGIL